MEGCSRRATDQFTTSIHNLEFCGRHYRIVQLLKLITYGLIPTIVVAVLLLMVIL